MKRLDRFLVEKTKRRLRQWVRLQSVPDAGQILSALYDPWPPASRGLEAERFYFRDPQPLRGPVGPDGLPLPPTDWRQGYYPGDDAGFLASGKAAADQIRSIAREHGLSIGGGDAVLDWGCASGRVLRHFAAEAQVAEFWGVDLDARLIAWAKENLWPPFHFVTGSAYPHLPFEDHKFSLVYAHSVFTHIEHLADAWIMELRRVMRRGGLAVLSAHTEDTVAFMDGDKRGEALRRWLPAALGPREILAHEVTVVSRRGWQPTLTFYRSDWLRREWGRYFEFMEIRPPPENSKQPAVVLRKA